MQYISVFHYFLDFNPYIYIYLYIFIYYIHICWIGTGEYPFYELQVELFSPRSTRNVPGILLVDAEH